MTESLVVSNREILSVTVTLHIISQASSSINNQPKVPVYRGNWLLQLTNQRAPCPNILVQEGEY